MNMLLSFQKCGIEKLVEELCIRLKDTASQGKF